MYEGWHFEFTAHARRRMHERLVDEADVRATLASPDSVEDDPHHGGRLIAKYLPEWDRILILALEERESEGVLSIKTVLWSKAK